MTGKALTPHFFIHPGAVLLGAQSLSVSLSLGAIWACHEIRQEGTIGFKVTVWGVRGVTKPEFS